VGIVSLGDVARHLARQDVIAKSLQAISAPIDMSAAGRPSGGRALIGFAVAALGAMMAWLTLNRFGRATRKQLVKSDLYRTAQHALSSARDNKVVRNARRGANATLTELAAQLPTLEYKPAKVKHGLFA
jgi:hypothetical protein